ncbi:MAG: hypothetical protein HF975_11195 [ANME-2 cluster archaeon]|nr:hypothetical protein [ANME-2 cluster archaeon]MBC2747542.1 hypothetical protein [ANME-2 cluster archaeon]
MYYNGGENQPFPNTIFKRLHTFLKNNWIILIICFGLFFILSIPVVKGESAELSLSGGDAIWYDLTVDEPGLIIINSRTDGLSDCVNLYLYDPNGDEVATYEVSSLVSKASIRYNAVTTGTYKVKSYLKSADNTRNISTTSSYPLSLFPHNKRTTTDVIRGDAIWYDLTVSEPGVFGINSWTDGSSDCVNLYLYDPNGDEVATYEVSSLVSKASVTFAATITGNYRVKSYLKSADTARNISTTSSYPLSLLPHDKRTTTDVIRGDAIWYDLTVNEPGVFGINSWTDGSSDCVNLYLYDPNGDAVATYEVSSLLSKASVTYFATTTGNYRVKSSLESGDTARNISTSSPYPLSLLPHNKKTTTDVIKGDVIFYDLTVSEPGVFGINSWTDGSSDCVNLYLNDPNGNEVATYKVSSLLSKASITYAATTTGTYLVISSLESSYDARNISTSSPYPLVVRNKSDISPNATRASTDSPQIPPTPKPSLPVFPIAVSAGVTAMVGIAAAIPGNPALNCLSYHWRKIDELINGFLRAIGGKIYKKFEHTNKFKCLLNTLAKLWAKLFSVDMMQKWSQNNEIKVERHIEIIRLILAGGILFLAFSLEACRETHISEFGIKPLLFIVSLAFFAMLAEIGHDFAIKISHNSLGGKSIFKISFFGAIVTIISGWFGFVITAAGGTRISNLIDNSFKEAIAASSGAIFNLTMGFFLLLFSNYFPDFKWLVFTGAMPNLAYATFSLFPIYPFEGRDIIKGNCILWGILFFLSLMFYLLIL